MGRHAAARPTAPDVTDQSGGPDPSAAIGVRVVSGDPTPEELAAVIAVLQRQADEAEAAGRTELPAAPRNGWDVSARGLRRPLDHGVAWARSLR